MVERSKKACDKRWKGVKFGENPTSSKCHIINVEEATKLAVKQE